jgi:SAM-dependent methyltransferase
VETVDCNLCGSKASKSLFKVNDLRYAGKQFFDLVQCVDCGLIYVNPRPGAIERVPYYERYYSNDRFASRVSRERFTFLRHDDVKRLKKYKAGGRMLDVGCGTGEFLSKIVRNGWETVGTELNPKVAQYARGKNRIHVIEKDLAEIGLKPDSFDVVRLHHVIEHLADPLCYLSIIHRLLKSDGLLIIACPNFTAGVQKWFAGTWDGLDAPRHLYHFNVDSLRRILAKAGFEAIDVYHTQWFDNFVIFKNSLFNKFNLTRYECVRENIHTSKKEFRGRKSVELLKLVFNLSLIGLTAALSLAGSGQTIEAYCRKQC